MMKKHELQKKLPQECKMNCFSCYFYHIRAFLHQNKLLHRDLKPGNILMSKSGCKITDFGLTRTLPELTSTITQNAYTTLYAAPV